MSTKRKKPLTSVPMKRHKSDPTGSWGSTDDVEELRLELQVQTFQQSKMALALLQKNREISRLSSRVGGLQADNTDFVAKLAALSGFWDQLVGDIRAMLLRAGEVAPPSSPDLVTRLACPRVVGKVAGGAPGGGADGAAGGGSGTAAKDEQVDDDNDDDDDESAVRPTAAFDTWLRPALAAREKLAKDLLARCLGTFNKSRPVEAKIDTLQIAEREAAAAARSARAECALYRQRAANAEAAEKKESLSRLMAQRKTARLEADLKSIRDELDAAAEKLKQEGANRSLQGQPRKVQDGQKGGATTARGEGGKGEGAAGGAFEEERKKLKLDLADARALAEARQAEIERAHSETLAASELARNLRVQVAKPSTAVIQSSGPYVTLRADLFACQEDLRKARDDASTAERESQRVQSELDAERKRVNALVDEQDKAVAERLKQANAARLVSQQRLDEVRQKSQSLEGAQAALERANSLNKELRSAVKRTTERLRAAQADAKTATEKLEQGSGVSAWLVLLGRYKRKLAAATGKADGVNGVSGNEEMSNGGDVSGDVSDEKTKLRQECEAQKEANEALVEALDDMAGSFDEASEQNERLQGSLKELDDMRSKLLASTLRLRGSADNAKREAREQAAKVKMLEDLVQSQKKLLEAEKNLVRASQAETKALQAEVKKLTDAQEALSRTAGQAARDATEAAAERDARAKEIAALRDDAKKTARVKSKLQRQLVDAQHKASRYKKRAALTRAASGDKGGGSAEYTRELQSKVICSLCSANEKNVIITRCLHCFCRQCIMTNLDKRNRKCPACGKMYSKSDVKPLYL